MSTLLPAWSLASGAHHGTDLALDFRQNCEEVRLIEECLEAGIECRVLKPAAKDLNVDLRDDPVHIVKTRMLAQMKPRDRSRFQV